MITIHAGTGTGRPRQRSSGGAAVRLREDDYDDDDDDDASPAVSAAAAAAAAAASTAAAAASATRASDLEKRLAVLERRVGIAANTHGTNTTRTASVDDRLSGVKRDLERNLGSAATGNEQSWKEIRKLLRELDPGIALTHQQQPLLYKRQQILAASGDLHRDFGELNAILGLLLSGTRSDGRSSSSPSGAGGSDPKQSSKPKPSRSSPQKQGKQGSGPSSSSFLSPAPTTPGGKNDGGAGSGSVGNNTPGNNLRQQQQNQKEQQEQQQQQQKSRSSGREKLRLEAVTQAPILTHHVGASSDPAGLRRAEDLRQKLADLQKRTGVLGTTLRHYLECYHTAAVAVSEKIVLADETIAAAAAAAATKQ